MDVNDRQKILNIVSNMTREEKARLVIGADKWHTLELKRLGVPSIMMTDGPHGLRKESEDGAFVADSYPATCFPTASALACSFDSELVREIGSALAREADAANVSVVLGPGVNIKRNPRCGRNFEYFSEDPTLSGSLAAAYINGAQSEGVGVCLKHFALNNQESKRFVSDSCADMRTMRELYLRAFEIAVKRSAPASVMSSYNLINGCYAGESPWLLTDLLRREWGFDGTVISDWGAVRDRVAALKAGLDLEMPGDCSGNTEVILDAVADGTLAEWQLDAAAANVLALVSRCGTRSGRPAGELLNENHRLAARAAAECCVLLKNDDRMLPLSRDEKTAIIGEFARSPRFQGAGSSHVNPTRVTSLESELISREIPFIFAAGFMPDGSTTDELLAEARSAAKNCKKVVIVAGLPDEYESEGFDRDNLALPDGVLRLIKTVAQVNPNTAVALQLGSPAELPFEPDVKSILVCYLGGQAGGAGLADILYGRKNPSGKLAETWPRRLSDVPNEEYYAKTNYLALYREGIYSGYRYYDAVGVRPLYPFGHGLSYSSFALGRPSVSASSVNVRSSFTVTLAVTNTSDTAGTETVLLFAAADDSCRTLAAFGKILLMPGEKGTLTLNVNAADFAYFNTSTGRFELQEGRYSLTAAGTNETVTCSIEAENGVTPPQYIKPSIGMNTPDSAWLPLLPCAPHERAIKPYNLNTTVGELKRTAVGKIVYSVLAKEMLGGDKHANEQMIVRSAEEMPLRALVAFSNGMLTKKKAQGIADAANGHLLRGLKKII